MKATHKVNGQDWAFRVHQKLMQHRVETPSVVWGAPAHSTTQALERVQQAIRQALEALGLDLQHEDFAPTPFRVASHWIQEAFYGLNYQNFPRISLSSWPWDGASAGRRPLPVEVDAIRFVSYCAHHLVPMEGSIRITYLPKSSLLGLSKFHRVCKFFAARPQLQERLTAQLHLAFQTLLGTEDVEVRIESVHHCVKARGVEDCSSVTRTKLQGGAFLPPSFAPLHFEGNFC